jgi:hypothetical protein
MHVFSARRSAAHYEAVGNINNIYVSRPAARHSTRTTALFLSLLSDGGQGNLISVYRITCPLPRTDT